MPPLHDNCLPIFKNTVKCPSFPIYFYGIKPSGESSYLCLYPCFCVCGTNFISPIANSDKNNFCWKIYLLLYCMLEHLTALMYVCHTCTVPRRPENCIGTLELELRTVVTTTLVLWTKLMSSGRAARTHNHFADSPAHNTYRLPVEALSHEYFDYFM